DLHDGRERHHHGAAGRIGGRSLWRTRGIAPRPLGLSSAVSAFSDFSAVDGAYRPALRRGSLSPRHPAQWAPPSHGTPPTPSRRPQSRVSGPEPANLEGVVMAYLVPAQAGAQLLSLFVYGLVARWYVAPWLGSLKRPNALIALLWVHVFRYVALMTFSAQ